MGRGSGGGKTKDTLRSAILKRGGVPRSDPKVRTVQSKSPATGNKKTRIGEILRKRG